MLRQLTSQAANGARRAAPALALALLFGAAGSAAAQQAGLGAAVELVDPNVFRVCADPNDMPYSNEKKEGYEDRIAKLLADALGKTVSYTYFPVVTGFVRHTLGEYKCDVIMSYPQGDELVQNTNPYYRTAYALVYKEGSDLAGIDTIGDPRLKGRKIGVVAGTPPATNMAVNGLMATARPYFLMVDTRLGTETEHMIHDIESGEIDAGLIWGPIAGYYAKKSPTPLVVVPLLKETTGPKMAYRITMGVRPSDQEWKRTLNKLIADHQEEINAILLDYGIPLLDESDNRITK